MRRFSKAMALGLATAGMGALLAITPPGAALEERLGLGWLFQLRGPLAPPRDVVVVALDRASAERLELPTKIREWPRTVYARMVERLSEAGASVIVFDLIFDRPRDEDPDQDVTFAEAVARSHRVILLEYLDRSNRSLVARDDGTGLMVATERVIQPIAPLAEAAVALAPFPLPKSSGRVAQFWSFRTSAGGRATLPVAALQQHVLAHVDSWSALLGPAGAQVLAGASPDAALAAETADPGQRFSGLRRALKSDPALHARLAAELLAADLDAGQRRLLQALLRTYVGADSHYLNFYGPSGHVRTVPAHRLLLQDDAAGSIAAEVAGRAVFVGQAELDNLQSDGFPTVFTRADGVDLSGVEIAATAFANLLDGRPIEPVSGAVGLTLVAGFGFAAGVAAGVLPAAAALAVALSLALVILTGAHLAFSRADLWLPLAVPLLVQLPLGVFGGLLVQFRDAQRARRNLSRGVSYYLPAKVVAGLAEAPRDPAQASELVYAACMVADAERFTSYAERVPAREVNAFLNRYFAILFTTVERHGGVVTDVVGDGMTAVWSAAAPDPRVRLDACRAAIEIDRAIAGFNRQHGPPGLPTRIGLHAGMVMLGNVGGGGRFAYSVVGNVVNTAARLETLNKQLGTRVLATAEAVAGLGELALRPLGHFRLAGKEEALTVLEILGFAGRMADDAPRTRFADALACFEAGRWAEAAARFEATVTEHPEDGAARFYLARCQGYARSSSLPPQPEIIRLEQK